ncbi:hypothetical protein V6Z11_A07G104500 [Gossypium hirsutum]
MNYLIETLDWCAAGVNPKDEEARDLSGKCVSGRRSDLVFGFQSRGYCSHFKVGVIQLDFIMSRSDKYLCSNQLVYRFVG